MEQFLTPEFWVAVGQIIMIDILLGGDNAVVIALACRKLPAHQRTKGILWGTAGAIIRRTRGQPELRWAHGLATMSQASLIGFAVGGAFLSLLYFDMPYYLMAALIATRIVVERQAPAPTARQARAKAEARAAVAEQP